MVGRTWQMVVMWRIVITKNQTLLAAVVAIRKLDHPVGLQENKFSKIQNHTIVKNKPRFETTNSAASYVLLKPVG